MTAKKSTKTVKNFRGVGGKFWLAKIYTPVSSCLPASGNEVGVEHLSHGMHCDVHVYHLRQVEVDLSVVKTEDKKLGCFFYIFNGNKISVRFKKLTPING